MKEMLRALMKMEELIPFEINDKKNKEFIQVNENNLPWEDTQEKFIYEFYFCPCKLSELIKIMIEKNKISELEKIKLMEEFLKNDFLTCFGAFEINENGQYISKSLKFTRFPFSLIPNIEEKNVEVFLVNLVESFKNPIFSKEDLKFFQRELLNFLGLDIPLNSLFYFRKLKYLNKDIYGTEKIELEEETSSSEVSETKVMFKSFFYDDLKKVIKDTENIGNGLRKYLNQEESKSVLNIENIENIRKIMNPKNLPKSRWISSPEYSLALMQSVSVNIAVNNELNGNVVSVNGPPGTGKTTLLKDIFAENIYKKALYLSSLSTPNFESSIEINLYDKNFFAGKFKIFDVPQELKDLSMVVTSFNNKAVENISKELPVISKEVYEMYDLKEADIFPNISNSLLSENTESDDINWGLISGTMGNSKNREKFFSSFYKECSFQEIDELILEKELNLKENNKLRKARSKNLLELQKMKKNSWEKVVSSFKEKEEEVVKFISKYESVLILLENKENINNKIEKLNKQLEIKIIEKSSRKRKKIEFLDFELKRLKKEIRSLENKINIEIHNYNKIDGDNTLKEVKDILQDNFPSQELWLLPSEEKSFQISSPWLCKEFNKLRSELFVESLKLNKQFLLNNMDKVITFSSLLYALEMRKAEILYDEDKTVNKAVLSELKKYRVQLYDNLFLMVPILSCTFASFQTMFSDFKKESLGWVFVDEAGQALPQTAVGAIWRSKNSVIVGDPLQIEPVNPLPKNIFDLIEKTHNIKDRLFYESSVQTFGDKINNYKGLIGDTEVGIPLKVHRRCIEPMFSIANEIAYDNKMIIATGSPKGEVKSFWLHVKSSDVENHYNKEQGNKIKELLKEKFPNNNSPEVFIISPFKNVVNSLKTFLDEYDDNWKDNNIGTVHTFQGKECKMVILCLGLSSDGSHNGAMNWASSKPNLLNVAVTRAKHELIIVGDEDMWKKEPYFEVAQNLLNTGK